MNVDFWTSSDHQESVKHVSASAVPAAQFSSETGWSEEDEPRAFFPCPFCYTEIELPLFCTHLQEEHCFDLRNAVCPICADNLGNNPIEHFSMKHTQSIRRRRMLQKYDIRAMDQPGSGKELRVVNSYHATASRITKNKKHEADPLLSPFLFNAAERNSNNYLNNKETLEVKESTPANKKRGTLLNDESEQQNDEQKTQRTTFVETLVMSTIF